MIQNNLDICINHKLYDIHLAKDKLFAIIVNDFFQYSLLLFLRQELLNDLDKLDWEPHIKELQRNWIGKSVGSEIDFEIVDASKNNLKENKLKIFTTRADTLYGCTFMAISYTLAKEWIENGWEASKEIKKFIEKLEKEKARLAGLIISIEKKLSNEGFIAKAPENVIIAEKEKLASIKDSLQKVETNLSALQ